MCAWICVKVATISFKVLHNAYYSRYNFLKQCVGDISLSICSTLHIVCLECNGASSNFFKNRFIVLFYCYKSDVWTVQMCFCSELKEKSYNCFIIWVISNSHVLKILCAKVLLAIEPLHSQWLSYFVVTCEIRKGCIGYRTIAFLIFAIRCCAEIIQKKV